MCEGQCSKWQRDHIKLKLYDRFYLKAIKQKPRFADAYNNLASTYMQLGQIDDAIETYQMALVIDLLLVSVFSRQSA